MVTKSPTQLFVLLSLFIMLTMGACTAAPEPPATVQAIAAASSQITSQGVEILQEQSIGGNQVMLYKWADDAGATCLATSYLSRINGEWQIRDTASTDCQSGTNLDFVASYTGISKIDSPFGQPRHTTVYGTSRFGHSVQVVWSDGQVSRIPLKNGSFLETRAGRWTVERIELFDNQNNLLLLEDWQIDA